MKFKSLGRIRRYLLRYYRRHIYLLFNAWCGKEAIILYTMGKVGSTTIYASLPRTLFRIQIHTLNPPTIERLCARYQAENKPLNPALLHAIDFRRHILKRGTSDKYISLVRNPIDRNISAFFENYRFMVGESFEESTHSIDELIERFMSNYDHERPLQFFQDEYHQILGVNVFDYPFPHGVGYQRIIWERGELLLMRTETPDNIKEQAIKEFLNLPDFVIQRANVGSEKQYKDVYSAFKRQIILPQSYIDQMLNAQYTRHFYTDEERQIIRDKWEERLRTSSKV